MSTGPGSRKAPAPLPKFFPRSVFGITAVILAFSLGAALSGAALFSYYEFREKSSAERVEKYVTGFNKRYKTATDNIDQHVSDGEAEIEKSLEPLRKTRADGETINSLVNKYGTRIWFVSTSGSSGEPSVGTAFAVKSDGSQTLLLTSLNTVRAATKKPGPTIKVKQGSSEVTATLRTWDDKTDLALLIIPEGNHDTLDFIGKKDAVKRGTQIFALSGLGTDGGSATAGFITDVFDGGIQTSALIGPQFQGGPMINAEGKVVAVASRTYSPAGFVPDDVYFAPEIRAACNVVLDCPSNQ